jgi:hypothetical protein
VGKCEENSNKKPCLHSKVELRRDRKYKAEAVGAVPAFFD